MKTVVPTHATTGWLKVLLFLIVLSQVRCDVLDLFRESCPYNKFCTMDRLSNTTQEQVMSCCLDCFCDEACHAYGDCCPDIHSYEPMTSDNVTGDNFTGDVSCHPDIAPTEYYFTDHQINVSPRIFRMFGTCPSDFIDTDGIVDKCEQEVYDVDRSFDDTVIVSGPNTEMYRNNSCALCHGVTDGIRWSIKVTRCNNKFESLRLPLSKVKPYIMQKCILQSVQPTNLPVSSRLLPCNRGIVSECSDNVTSTGLIEDEVIEGCLNGPHMLFTATNALYKNAMCHRCNGLEENDSNNCFDLLGDISRTFTKVMTRLLNSGEQSRKQMLDYECGESGIKDTYTNMCRDLYCPPYEAVSYGTCHRIAIPTHKTVRLRSVFWTDEEILVSPSLTRYNTSVEQHYAKKMREMFADLACPGMAVFVEMFTEQETNKLVQLVAEMMIGTNQKKCTIKDIGNTVRRQTSINMHWLINDRFVQMKGQHSFFRNPVVSNMTSNMLVFTRVQHISIKYIDEFIVCPYIEIDLDLYNTLLATHGGPGDVTNLTTLTMTTETLDGMYVLSEDQLAVCVDLYATDTTNGASGFFMFERQAWAIFALLGAILLDLLEMHE